MTSATEEVQARRPTYEGGAYHTWSELLEEGPQGLLRRYRALGAVSALHTSLYQPNTTLFSLVNIY